MQSKEDILKEYWGYDSFRPLQADIIQSVMDQKDTLAILPTGGGKSICYQVPALLMEGVCLVVSPLISLINDQFQGLQKRGIKAAFIHSGISFKETELILENTYYGAYKFLFIAPERLQSENFRQRLKHLTISFVAVDEAHCISEWGYDFRPSYLKISELKELIPGIHILALTASATPSTIKDIQQKLGIPEQQLIQGSFFRSNLGYVVKASENKKDKILEILKKVKGSTIVYAATRKSCEDLSKWLQVAGFSAQAFHAGKSTEERLRIQNSWINNDIRIIVATNAFGMGIDKPNVRLVIHYNIPQSLEAYYQEAGRAGRDGVNSYAIVLFDHGDIAGLKERIERLPDLQFAKDLYQTLSNEFQIAQGDCPEDALPFDIASFCHTRNLDVYTVLDTLNLLEHEGHLKYNFQGNTVSKVHIPVSASDLYEFQVSHLSFDGFIKTLLRSYSGLFEAYTTIDEYILSKRLQISVANTEKLLHQLHQFGVISYIPKTKTGNIEWLKARETHKYFKISKESVTRIQQIKKGQIQASIDYLHSVQCRSQYILQYFGEEMQESCGVCDICRAKRLDAPEDRANNKLQAIKDFIQQSAHTLEEIQEYASQIKKEEILEILELLLDEGVIIYKENKYYKV